MLILPPLQELRLFNQSSNIERRSSFSAVDILSSLGEPETTASGGGGKSASASITKGSSENGGSEGNSIPGAGGRGIGAGGGGNGAAGG